MQCVRHVFQILVQICTDLTLCMLSLMMSETPTAMSHLLQAVSSLHEAGHLHVMQGLLRLFLPQGIYKIAQIFFTATSPQNTVLYP